MVGFIQDVAAVRFESIVQSCHNQQNVYANGEVILALNVKFSAIRVLKRRDNQTLKTKRKTGSPVDYGRDSQYGMDM